MSGSVVIENARILDPGSGRDIFGAVLVDSGRILDIVEGRAPGAPLGIDRIDAGGLVLIPGLIDTRVFTGEPGHEYRETLASASEAAAAGGVTSFLAMPDTLPVIDDGALVDFVLRRANATAKVHVIPSAAISKGLLGKELSEFGLLKEAGARALTEGRKSIASSALLRAAFSYAANFGLPVLHQPLDTGLKGAGVMNEGALATGLGLAGIPVEAETISLNRDIQLAALTGVRYHAAQISCGRAVDFMARAKQELPAVSCGASINNLSLNENDIGSYRTFFKLSPPLRHESDRLALVEGLRDGIIDTIHSDHDPQDVERKRQPFAEAADGAIGLETLLAAALRLVHSGDVPLMTVLKAMTINPARLIGLDAGHIAKGAPADLALIDFEKPWVVEETRIRSRSRNTAFEKARMTGSVERTIVAGETVFTREPENLVA
jgi:dihydroorotase